MSDLTTPGPGERVLAMQIDEYAVSPKTQEKLDMAARRIRAAITAVRAALDSSAPDSDAEDRCQEAWDWLEEALAVMEWTPEKGEAMANAWPNSQ